MQNLFNNSTEDDITEEDEDTEDCIKPYECAMCSSAKFATIEELEKHFAKEHSNQEITDKVIDEVADEFANEVANIEAAEKPVNLLIFDCFETNLSLF